MCGIPGSGKTTYASMHYPGALICSADHGMLVDGQYAFAPKKLSAAHGACFRKAVEALQAGEELIVVDNTNLTAVEISPYMAAAQAYGVEAKVVTLRIDPAIAGPRNQHGIPHSVVVNLARRLDETPLEPRWRSEVYAWNVLKNCYQHL
jgi:predicted kinase